MKRLLLLGSLALIFGLSNVYASGLCVNGSTYYDLVNNPCQVGSFFNVTFSTMGTSGAVGGNNGTGDSFASATVAAIEKSIRVYFTANTSSQIVVDMQLTGDATGGTLKSLGIVDGSKQATFNFQYTLIPLLAGQTIDFNEYTVDNIKFKNTSGSDHFSGFKQIRDPNGNTLAQTDLDDLYGSADGTGWLSDSASLAVTHFVGGLQVQDNLHLTQDVPAGQGANSLYFGGARLGDAADLASWQNTLSFTSTPEPASMFLAGVGLIGLGLTRRRRK